MKKTLVAIASLVALGGCTTSPLAHRSEVLMIGKGLYSLTATNASAVSGKQDAIQYAIAHCEKSSRKLETVSMSSSSDGWGWHTTSIDFQCL